MYLTTRLSTVVSDTFVCLGCHPAWKYLLSNQNYRPSEKNIFFFLTNAGHVLLLVCFCRVFVCHVEGIVLCITIICAICFLWSMFVFLLEYTQLIFCIYLYGYSLGKISWISFLLIVFCFGKLWCALDRILILWCSLKRGILYYKSTNPCLKTDYELGAWKQLF